MKKALCLLAVTLLLATATACAEDQLSATIDGNTVSASYTPKEALEKPMVVICSENASTRYAIIGIAFLGALAAGETGEFTVDLANGDALYLTTDLQTGTSEYTLSLTQEQRDAVMAGKMSIEIYRSNQYAPGELLAKADIMKGGAQMTVSSTGIVNGVLADAYGKKGTQKRKGIPSLSVPLAVSGLPAGTQALAVSMIDPDGGDWVHWLAANIPVMEEIPQNASIDLAGEMAQGVNDFGFTGYGGPTPPSGTHTYVFTVYALSAPLALTDGFTLKAFQEALSGKVLAQAVVTGDYKK